MLISYVLPVYNEQSQIAVCLDSLFKQRVKPHEIIVINDASEDNTGRLLQWYDKAGKIKLITNEERRGAASCRNYGNGIASGDIIAVCDAEWYHKDRSVAIKDFFETFPEKDIFHSSVTCEDSKTGERWHHIAVDWDFNSKCPVSHPSVAYRRKVTDQVKYPEFSKDTDLYEFFLLEANEKGFKMGGTDHSLLTKIEGNTNRDKSKARELKRKMYEGYGICL